MTRLFNPILLIYLFFPTSTFGAISLGDSIGLSPFWDWKTIESEHFRLNYPDELKSIAQITMGYLEEAHQALSPTMHWEPKTKTEVILLDNADAANGMASAGLRLGIILYATPPESWFEIADTDDWLRMLIFHEYTHILNIDAYSSFWEAFRFLFGDWVRPNQLLPRWMVEGLAVYMETRHTGAGRGRSTYFDMQLRAAVEDGVLDENPFVTLDKLGGRNPYYPGGDTPYQFGYHLMNQAVREATKLDFENPDEVLGITSERSGGRVPYFINGNLENVIRKDWHALWREWVIETRERMEADLEKIRSQPVTRFKKLTQNGYSIRGPAISPDGKWIAYSRDSNDDRSGVYLLDLKTGESTRVADKLLGATMAFTPDSGTLIFSSLHIKNQYQEMSDLAAYSVASGRTRWLTEELRAKDPDVSPDGKHVVFTITKAATSGLAMGNLFHTGEGFQVAQVRTLYMPAEFDRVATPKFSPDGDTIAFSIHRNAKLGEDILTFHIPSGKLISLVADGALNRFPTFNSRGDLFFISGTTGVDNLYRMHKPLNQPFDLPTLATNMTTGIWFPVFGPRNRPGGNKLYASVFSSVGWDLARVYLSEDTTANMKPIPVSKPPAPKPISKKRDTSPAPISQSEAKSYSAFSSLWPRAWQPYLLWGGGRYMLGGAVSGFDALDFHEYSVSALYDSLPSLVDVQAVYANRQLGPTLTLSAAKWTTEILGNDSSDPVSLIWYKRKIEGGATLAYPIRSIWSVLTPSVSARAESELKFEPSVGEDPTEKNYFVPTIDGLITFASPLYTALGISPEGGRLTEVGVRAYFDHGQRNFKALLADTEFLRITQHTVLVPSLAVSWVSRLSAYDEANVAVRGRERGFRNSVPQRSFDSLGLRGYPNQVFRTRSATVGSLEYRFPISRVYRGFGTHPAFLNFISGFAFLEGAYFPEGDVSPSILPAIGTGIRASSTLGVVIPFEISLEAHHGLANEQGGRTEFLFRLSYVNL